MSLSYVFDAHTIVVELAVESWAILANSLLQVYTDFGDLEDACHVLSTIRCRDKFMWNHMIKAYGTLGYAYEAFQCFDHMQMEGVLPDMFVYASLLSTSATRSTIIRGQQIHSIITNCGIPMDVVAGTALVNMYGKFGRLKDAVNVFYTIDKCDIAAWNALIANHAQQGHVQDSLEFLTLLQNQEVSPNKVTFMSILPAFVDSSAAFCGMEVHDLVLKYGFESDLNLANALLSMYGKCGRVEDGLMLFDSMPEKNTLTWTVTVQCLVQNGDSNNALLLFNQMQNEGAVPDSVTYINMLSAFSDQDSLVQGKIFHALLIPGLGKKDIELNNALLNMYSKCGSLETAESIFNGMVERSVISWNAMIYAYVQHEQNHSAIQLFTDMVSQNEAPDRVTFLSVLSACAQETGPQSFRVLEKAMDVHSMVVHYGMETDVVLGNTLILVYGKHKALQDAQGVFESLSDRNVVSWNIIIVEKVQDRKASEILSQMLEEGVMPNRNTITSILTACKHSSLLTFGKDTHARISVSMYGLDTVTGNRLIDMYLNCGSVSCAQEVFNCLLDRDIIIWTQMIGGYVNWRQNKLALNLFDRMQQESLGMDRVTLICILSACASCSALAKGKSLHACISGSGLEHDVAVGNALLNMYGKCGNMREAHTFFSQMAVTDVVSWSSMIANYAQHGHSKNALQVFDEMQHQNVVPDQITFLSVLSAFSHAGRVVEGCYWFRYMKQSLGIEPTLDHYNCMINLLGRAGMLTEAEEMIRDMPFEADIITWMTLLGASRFHVDVVRGEQYAREAFRLNPLDPAPYVMLSNIYFSAGREEQAVKVITEMKEMGMGQGKFCSFIQIGGKVHKFYDNDFSHPQREQIHSELQLLTRRLVEANDTYSKILLLKNDEFRQNLLNHGEKWALAFGIISTPLGTTLVISKDSEICFDCHTFIKLVSQITGREIILKDLRQSHYIHDGVCSCGDLW
ncbi:hypothetical protein KP509_14G059200 [Ceratopteris richardii]|nr:hypothetical protein KP509_14G059200 [Ceratopteris richardii]